MFFPQEKKDLEKEFKDNCLNGKLIVVEPAVDPSQFISPVNQDTIFKKFNLPQGRNFVLFLADLKNPRKGFYEAIRIINEVRKSRPSVHLLACGSWPDREFDYKTKQIYPLIKILKMENNMTILGPVTIPEKARLFLLAKVFLSPTVYESFGIALAEALYNNLPVVATKIGGVPTVVSDKKTGFLIDGHDNIHEFAEKVVFLLDHEDVARKMGESGHRQIVKKFNWKRAVDKIERIYEKAISH